MTWRWLGEALILAIHEEHLAEHGGGAGVRDIGLLQSALARPINQAAYGEPSVHDLAAAYAFGIARNHPFVDGNKRTAFVAATLFLLDHGLDLTASDAAAVTAMLHLAEGGMREEEFAAWLRDNTAPIEA
ncbi:MAG: type II toxin-antitoxin system death-on-curing family toxin [Alphaproteobacteria bacterium]|nr:type II toxin-antitoxin system death-on-curing family toxin [Alphaproteobacteria bacterium]